MEPSFTLRVIFCFGFAVALWGLGYLYVGREAWFWAFAAFLGTAGFLLIRPSIDMRTRISLVSPVAFMMALIPSGMLLYEQINRGVDFFDVLVLLGLSHRVVCLTIFFVGTLTGSRLLFRHHDKRG